ncbi:MAG TPA: hypothetical protein DEQ61_19820 [Streptomyces sp.]|nr:hypothetical protein [Streptomyces sp.]
MAERNTGAGPGEGPEPFDEEAAWAAIVAGYGQEPTVPGEENLPGPGAGPEPRPEPGPGTESGAGTGSGAPAAGTGAGPGAGQPGAGPGLRSSGSLEADKPYKPGPEKREGIEPDADADADSNADDTEPETGSAGSPASPAAPAAPADRPLGSSVTVHPAGIGPRDWSPEAPEEDGEGHFVPPEPPPPPRGDMVTRCAWLAVLGGPLLLIVLVVAQQPVTWLAATVGVGGFLCGFGTLVYRMKDDDEFDDPGRGAVV